MAAPVLELRSVTCTRGEAVILDEVSLRLEEGEAAFFMGAAGSGKSALLKAASGLDVASAGEILFRGRELSRMTRREEAEFRRKTGFVFQDAALWANQSLYDNLALPVRIHEPGLGAAAIDAAVRRAAELVGYDEELRARPAELSLGERRLIGLARALVLDPELLYMDEPAANLDEESAERVHEIQAALKDRGRSLFVASSSSAAVSRFADRVGVLRGGRLLAYGSFDEAAAWTDPALRGITGRLKARKAPPRPEWASSLAGAWADALAEDKSAVDEPEWKLRDGASGDGDIDSDADAGPSEGGGEEDGRG
ncbi:MAG TPA: ATP-binding cassette domain-containing protein [Spirochaetales bacterium]|nr:ATP-binding cassette domain-containing protein [Spirochaetales bacterium]HRY54774.1 ATP-binding cassette domain-containing protein [Spirochaetia bacterium]HRZ64308.1 ATP-binding cassette domain-containing protein [Spirochaetia bacterium]